MSELLFQCMTKATNAEENQVRHSFNWVVSRRGILKVYDDRLVCGVWTILFTEITGAVLTSIRSTFFLPGYVLRIDTAGKSYHFGLNGRRFWESDLPFPIRGEKGRLGYSVYSVLVRITLLVALAYWLWQKLA